MFDNKLKQVTHTEASEFRSSAPRSTVSVIGVGITIKGDIAGRGCGERRQGGRQSPPAPRQ